MRLLMAEDDEPLRSVLDRGLRGNGYVVDAVSDGEQAVAASDAWRLVTARSFPPDGGILAALAVTVPILSIGVVAVVGLCRRLWRRDGRWWAIDNIDRPRTSAVEVHFRSPPNSPLHVVVRNGQYRALMTHVVSCVARVLMMDGNSANSNGTAGQTNQV
jgi:CheY-like chemotaxis protein